MPSRPGMTCVLRLSFRTLAMTIATMTFAASIRFGAFGFWQVHGDCGEDAAATLLSIV